MNEDPHGDRVGRWTLLMALGAAGSVSLLVLVGGALTPGYSHVDQFISELGASGAAYEWPVRLAGFLPAGLFLLAFCGLAHRCVPSSRAATFGLLGIALYAAGYLVATVFPCDPGCRPDQPSMSQAIHNAGGMLGYLLAPASLFTMARAARGWPGAGSLSLVGYAASALALLGLLTLSPASPVVGISQRVLEASVLGWVVCCGVHLARNSTSRWSLPDAPM